ncbi:hypothetical protein ACIBCM_07420 [Streptomyces sp. NPDC051018]|uniref:hypothetical protein n=1 Tax=Streptomyces sp. NPDC051018 TaxID=3365639 RepID=UPI0037AE7B0D
MHRTTRTTLFPAALAAVLLTSGCGGVGDIGVDPVSDSRSFGISGPKLTIDTTGDVRVESGKGSRVKVSRELAGKAAEDGNASWELEGDTLRLTAECKGLVLNCGSHYTVEVPPGVTAVSVRTKGGEVAADSLPGALTVETKTGDIRVTKGSGELRLSSDTGRVSVSDSLSADVRVSSRDADHTLSFARAPRRVVDRTGKGDISVTLPEDNTRYRIDASAQREDKARIGVGSDRSAANRLTLESPRGRVRVAQK